MAAAREATGRGDRALVVASLAVLAASAGAALGRLFQGRGPSLRLAIAGTAAVLVAEGFRRRSLVLSLAVASATMVIAAGMLVFPETTWAGLPTAATVEAVVHALGTLGADATREVAPAAPLPSLLMASLLAAWAAASAAHALAVRTGSAVLAVVPPAALLAFADAVASDGTRPGYAAAFLIGALGVLLGVGIEGLRGWGTLVRTEPRQRRLLGGPRGRWATVTALCATGLAVAAPGVLPAYEREALVTFEPQADGGSVTINPIVDIRPSLLRNPPAELFAVRSDRPAYWRMLSLDRFTGGVWTASDLGAEEAPMVAGSSALHEESGGRRESVVQRFEIQQLSTLWLPAAFEPRSINLPMDGDGGSSIRYDADAGMLVRASGTEPGYAYDVVSEVPVARPRRLDRAYAGVALDAIQQRLAPYVALPDSLPAEIRTIADRVAGGQPTPFRRVLAIQEHLRSFAYSEEAPPGHGADHMVNFLTETRTGYCEQFAGTMAVLVRALGYPARVAVGFLPGQPTSGGWYRVTTGEAHAWPEVYFPGVGWLAFEPTPGRTNPVARGYTSPPVPLGGAEGGLGAALRERRERPEDARAGASPAAPDYPASGTAGELADRSPAWRVVMIIVAAATLLLALALWKAAARRAAVARARSPRQRVAVTWAVFEAGAADLGMGRRSGETLQEYAARLRAHTTPSDGHVERLSALAARALYSASPMEAGDAGQAGAAARAAARDLRRSSTVGRVAVAAIRPSRPV